MLTMGAAADLHVAGRAPIGRSRNAIERQKKVVLVVEIEASVLSGNRGCQQADTNAA
jgi:hypothetical protein